MFAQIILPLLQHGCNSFFKRSLAFQVIARSIALIPSVFSMYLFAPNSIKNLTREILCFLFLAKNLFSPKSLISQQPLVETSGSFRQITLEFNLYNDRSVSFKVSHDFSLVPFILPLTRIVPLIKKTYG